MSEHLARHALEEMLAGTAPATELHAHLTACERCSERLRNMERARSAYQLQHPATDFARAVSAEARRTPAPQRRLSRWAAVGGALALAAAAIIMLRAPSTPEIRYRGTTEASMQVYVQSETGARLLREGEPLSGGTQLAFTYTLSKPGHLMFFGLDDAGAITRYFPDGQIAKSSALAAGATLQLPVGVELDARHGRERLIALFSDAPPDEASARAAIASAWNKAHARGKDIREPLEITLPAKQISMWFAKP